MRKLLLALSALLLALITAGSSTRLQARPLCFYCPIYPDIGCSCDWILCDGQYICGRPIS
jgi:hypothetical protein